ncbi:MAG: phosphatidate cytidylyltransferase [Bacteroidales bacterium]|nr:phosphatidate cytidylyltransferase [Bacteroidales bacterium]
MNNLLTRTLYGLIFAFVMVASILYSVQLLAGVLLFFAAVGIVEIVRLHTQKEIRKKMLLVYMTPALLVYILLALGALEYIEPKILSIAVFFLIFPMIHALFSKYQHYTTVVGIHWSAMFFVSLPLALMLYFYRSDLVGPMAGAGLLLLVIVFIWINDIFAYLIGMRFGKHRLFERVSPKKSWEGSVGGLVFTMAVAWLVASYFDWITLGHSLTIAVIVIVSGTLGDLTESKMKREAGVKDSGKLLPGHGGVLDRFDATFFAIPFVFIYLLIVNS